MLLSISICLSDLNKDLIQIGKNGKKYINLSLSTQEQPNQWGKDVSVYEYDKETKKKHFVGNGTVFKNNSSNEPKAPIDQGEDIPF